MSTSADPLLGRLLEDRYRLDALVARGGMATVYTATDTRLDRVVAVKVMHRALADDPDFVARFTREARAAARLACPEAVSVFDQGTDGPSGLAYLVMEHVPGGTLRDLLREQGAQTSSRAVALLVPVLRALAAAHAVGLVHRDVKPENVLLGDDGRIKVADFGLARAVEASTLTATTGLLMGTAAYMAPEQVDTGDAGPRSDVYAAGVVLFELLTGAPPYGGDSSVRVAYRHVHEDVPAPGTLVAGVPPALDDLVVRATRRDPAARPADAGAFLAELLQVQGGRPLVPVQPGRPQPTLVVRREAADTATATDRTTDRATDGATDEARPEPARPRRRRRGRLVAGAVALAAVVALLVGWVAGARSVTVPTALGLPQELATQRLETRGLQVRVGPGTFSETVPPGEVAEQRPAPGHSAHRGGTVILALSKGPDRRALPRVVGLTQEAASAAVAKAGLRVGTVVRAYSDAPVGQVVAAGARAGTPLRPASPVNLTVSKGPELLEVPSVAGDAQADAVQALQRAGFRALVQDVFSEDVPKGAVVSADPPGGRLPRGGQVTVSVSKGPERIAVPDLTRMTADQAAATLAALGLQSRGVRPPLFGGNSVSRQEPGPGTLVKRGATVTYLLT